MKKCDCGGVVFAHGSCKACLENDIQQLLRDAEEYKKGDKDDKEFAKYLKRMAYQRRWKLANPEKWEEQKRTFHKRMICSILKKHARELKDDPERLTTEFMQLLIGIECKKNAQAPLGEAETGETERRKLN